ncbi:chemotaxis protein CheB [Calothrix sp. NIES-2098]|uniref:chemotaxis protein CheB n=1 Tax=Calothrix sp. NIES-2098 TaxID=1954171 RepID=UPI000B5F9961|nr:CheB methylesterase [Calothrix sp. NIES-2098]
MAQNQKQAIVRDLIVVGASAGGVEALTYLVKQLPTDFNAAVMVVLHVHSQSPPILAEILNSAGKLPASTAQNGEAIEKGRIYVAPPEYHLRLQPGYLQLTKGPKENHHRPAIDPLFRSAARAYGRRAIAVLLTGMLDDGTAGLMAVKMRGGVAVVQDPDDAMYSGMPRSALENVEEIDYILPLSEIPSILVTLVNTPTEKPRQSKLESDTAQSNMEAEDSGALVGQPSTYTCPDCGGVLWEIEEGKMLHFKCHTGHAFGAETLMALQSEVFEEALWSAVRALQEKAMLSERMASRMRYRNLELAAQQMEQEAEAAKQRSLIIREVLEKGNKLI